MTPFLSSYLSAWITAWIPNALMAASTVIFVILAARYRRRTGQSVTGRLWAWAAAMVALVLAFNSSISAYSDALLSVHMLQHLLLIMVTPTLLVVADPWRMIRTRRVGSDYDGYDGYDGHDVRAGDDPDTVDAALARSRVWKVLTSPIFAVPLYGAAVVLTHLTTFQEVAVTHTTVRVAENLLYLVSGYLLFFPLLRRETPPRIPYLLRFITLIGAMGADTLAGVVLMTTTTVLAPAYALANPGVGPNALTDQQAAGAIMWVGGDLIMMVISIVIAVMWGTARDETGFGLGDWVENIRRRQILGDGWQGLAAEAENVDLDQVALDAYNAQLARLHESDRQ